MKSAEFALLLGLLFLLPGARAQEEPEKKADRLERLVLKLGGDSPEERDGAMEEIRKFGPGALPRLRQALQDSQDVEVRGRVETLLTELGLSDPAVVFAGRLGARRERLRSGGGDSATEAGVLSALGWLARHQDAAGGWSADGFGARCTGDRCPGIGERDYDPGLTGLALLAFLGAGYTPLSKDEHPDPAKGGPPLKFGEIVDRGLKRLIALQDREGCVGERGMKYLYGHAVAALALSEAWGMTRAKELGTPARKATEFILAAQNPGQGWRYSARCGDNDSSATGWAVMALEAAKLSGAGVPQAAFDGALAWFVTVTETNGYYRAGYNARGTGKVFVPGKNEDFDDHPSMSAIAVTARLFIERQRSAPELGAVNLVVSDLPEWKEHRIDFYSWYWGSQALFQYDGPEGRMWKRWNESLKTALLPQQKTGKDGCRAGSWDSSGERWGTEGGRVYATALNALTLETYYRYPVVATKK